MTKPDTGDLFGRRLAYPDPDAKERYGRLVGIDDKNSHLEKLLLIAFRPASVQQWAKKHHPKATAVLDWLGNRPPLAVLAGDVGCGKTELAESIGDPVARQLKIDVTLIPLSLSARG